MPSDSQCNGRLLRSGGFLTTRIVLLWLTVAAGAMAQSTFHGNVARTGVYDSPGPKQLNGAKWAFQDRRPSGFVAGDRRWGCVHRQHGWLSLRHRSIHRKEKWKYKSRMPITSSPAVADGILYFASSAGGLGAIDIATGKLKWVLPTEYERKFEAKNLHGLSSESQTIPDGWDLFMSSPAVDHGKVYFGSGDGNVYAVDAKSGVLAVEVFHQGCCPRITRGGEQHRLYRQLGQLLVWPSTPIAVNRSGR